MMIWPGLLVGVDGVNLSPDKVEVNLLTSIRRVGPRRGNP